MEIQDLKNNRDRIIKVIARQCTQFPELATKEIMTKMLVWLGSRSDIQDMKPTSANIDKFTTMVTLSWLKNDYKPVVTDEWLAKREAIKRGCLSSLMA